MDYSEGTIIQFNQKNERIWAVTSIWGNDNIAKEICIQDLVSSLKGFLADFQKDIYDEFSISLTNFLE